MKPLTEIAHDLIREFVHPGDIVIDATVGNGHDTLFLADCVGPHGQVFGFDIQQSAIDSASELLTDHPNVTLDLVSHAEMAVRIPKKCLGQVKACMFNLGYLPGSDKSLTTCEQTTIAGLEAAIELLRSGGICTILAYVGHPGGLEEANKVEQFLSALSNINFHQRPADSPTAPRLMWLQKH